jgi:prepilin-type processing-associated H-X9-DG protein
VIKKRTKGLVFKTATNQDAFTRTQLIVVVAAVSLLAVIALAAISAAKSYAMQNNCANQLKSIAVAFRVWEGDNSDRFPMQAYTNEFGAPQFATASNAFRYFQVMSNELSNPLILICPADKKRTPAKDFWSDFNGSHISYFIGLDADDKFPHRFLTGDSNMTNGTAPIDGIMELTATQPGGWTKERHGSGGNIALSDGSVEQTYGQGFQDTVQKTGLATNRLLFPQ